MNNRLLPLLFSGLTLLASATMAQAGCYADYKAKQDNPLRLHYGVAEVQGDCTAENAASQLAQRLASDGWLLLTVLEVFDESGLPSRRDTAGDYYLRY